MASPTRWASVLISLGFGDRQGSLACCSPWGHKESDTTEWPDWTDWTKSHLVSTENPSGCFQNKSYFRIFLKGSDPGYKRIQSSNPLAPSKSDWWTPGVPENSPECWHYQTANAANISSADKWYKGPPGSWEAGYSSNVYLPVTFQKLRFLKNHC